MRNLFFAASLLFCLQGFSQTFTGTGGTIPGTSTSQTCFNTTVTGVGVINGTYGLASVCINITHPNDDELEVVLTAPDGTVVPLTLQNGGSGNNYTNTCFTATAGTAIKFGSAPFTGSFLPEGYLGAVNNGQNANGVWRLCIQDRRNGSNNGSLNNWSLSFNNTPAPQPPAMPTCANTLPSTSDCSSATLVCDFNGQCGNTSGATIHDWAGSGLDGPCFGLENNSFIKFVASASTASFSVWVPNSNIANYNQGGIQMLFFSGTCGSGAVTTYGCYPHIMPYSSSGQPLVTLVSASGLTPGNTYYLMIDGFAGDHCNFVIAANVGVNVLNINPANPEICQGQSISLTASGGNGVYSWSPATNLSATSGTTVSANPPATATYTVTSTTVTGCPLTKDVTITVNDLPIAPVVSSTQTTCTIPTSTLTISSPIGAGLQYSIGGAYQTSPVFSGVSPGSYNVTVQNAAGCISVPTIVPVDAPPASPVAPTATVTTQPTCAAPTGSITITAPTGAGLQYSVGGAYQSSPVFNGLTPGNYNVTVQNASGCTSAAVSLTVNAAPTAPAAPTAVVTAAPTCTSPTGSISITAPLGAGFEYSINGTTYQASPVFAGLNPNTYSISVKDIATGCISAVSTLTVPAAPSTQPAPPNISTVQPTCSAPTGSIVITPPAGTNLEYSIDGINYQASPVFNNLAPGVYSVTVRNNTTGCISTATSITLNNPPVLPSAPTGSVTAQPDCINSTAVITISSPVGSNYEYSIDGGAYQSSPVFNSIMPGTHSIVVKNIVSSCESPALSLTVNPVPAAPNAPTLAAIQPECSQPLGTLTVTAPVGPAYQYSINGGSFVANPVFAALVPGSYEIKAKDIGTGCISAGTTLAIQAAALVPVKPILSVTQPACPILTGSIVVQSPINSNVEYSINATTYQSSPIFNTLPAGTYNVMVRYTGTNCVSEPTSAVVNALPPGSCTVSGDIYFPSAFSPNGDGLNDGFGPGPKTNLAAISQYSLRVFNRYGELVFKTNDPYEQWDGRYKGKILANNSYTWVAQYIFNGSPAVLKKGTVIIIR